MGEIYYFYNFFRIKKSQKLVQYRAHTDAKTTLITPWIVTKNYFSLTWITDYDNNCAKLLSLQQSNRPFLN